MTKKENLSDLKVLKEIEKDKQMHIRCLNERINELLKLRKIILNDIEKITDNIEKIEGETND